MRGLQDYAGRLAGLQRLLPARGAQTPAISGLEARETVVGHGRRQIVAARLGEFEEVVGHDDADGMAAEVLRTRIAAGVAEEPCHRRDRADFQAPAEHVARGLTPAALLAPSGLIQRHRSSLRRRSLPDSAALRAKYLATAPRKSLPRSFASPR